MKVKSHLFSRPAACFRILPIFTFVMTLSAVSCMVPLRSQAENLAPLIIGMEPTVGNTLIFVAANQKYFADAGLDVRIRLYPSETAAVEGMFKQEVAVATASEFVFARQVFAGEKVRALGSIDEDIDNYLIARKDRGIAAPADLAGKRIGVAVNTAAEYYLTRFLELNGLEAGQAALVNVGPQTFEAALARGEVDAVQAWQPYAQAIQDRMDSRVVTWPAQSEQVSYETILCANDWAQRNPRLVKGLLTALTQAATYINDHPGGAKAIVQKELGLTAAYMDAVWPQQQFQLTLDQSMILAMEDEARWMIQNGLTTATETPVFLNAIDVESLQSVSPDAVNLIR